MSNAPTISISPINNINIAAKWDSGASWDSGNWDTTYLPPVPFGLKTATINPIGISLETIKPEIEKTSAIKPVGISLESIKPEIELE